MERPPSRSRHIPGRFIFAEGWKWAADRFHPQTAVSAWAMNIILACPNGNLKKQIVPEQEARGQERAKRHLDWPTAIAYNLSGKEGFRLSR
jgi:hypothetical protein